MNDTLTIGNRLLYFVSQFHMYHWQTESYARHMALGALYEGLTDLADEFMETYIGVYGRVPLNTNRVDLVQVLSVNPINADSSLLELEEFLKAMDLPNTDLMNIRDEILGLVHKTKYLFSLS